MYTSYESEPKITTFKRIKSQISTQNITPKLWTPYEFLSKILMHLMPIGLARHSQNIRQDKKVHKFQKQIN